MSTYKRKDKKFNAKLVAIADHKQAEETIEKVYKSAWHLLIAATGCFELATSKTLFKRILSIGLVGFHLDSALCDALGVPTTPQRLLRRLRK